jgi:hypothetical protein
LPEDLPFRWQIGGAGLRIGRDAGFPVCDDYRPPFAFTGTIDHIAVESAALAPRAARASRPRPAGADGDAPDTGREAGVAAAVAVAEVAQARRRE